MMNLMKIIKWRNKKCATWEYIKGIQRITTLMLPDMVCENIEEALEKFSECEYKE